MKTSDEIRKAAQLLRREAGRAAMAYGTDLMYGGKECQTEEEWIDALDAGADALLLVEDLESRLAQAERERDAAVADLRREACCYQCQDNETDEMDEPCYSCLETIGERPNWQWRGVCAENSK